MSSRCRGRRNPDSCPRWTGPPISGISRRGARGQGGEGGAGGAGRRKEAGRMMGLPAVVANVAGKVILVGNPNVGKSVIFGQLTGRYVTVSNYPGTTVEVSRGETRERGKSLEIIDTPGVYSLLPMSEDERVTRDILMNEPGSVVLQVCDAKNMRRSLMITIQLAEMGVPLVLAVNMADEARYRGVMPKLEGREGRFCVPAA